MIQKITLSSSNTEGDSINKSFILVCSIFINIYVIWETKDKSIPLLLIIFFNSLLFSFNEGQDTLKTGVNALTLPSSSPTGVKNT
jgi:hypothetical protein